MILVMDPTPCSISFCYLRNTRISSEETNGKNPTAAPSEGAGAETHDLARLTTLIPWPPVHNLPSSDFPQVTQPL